MRLLSASSCVRCESVPSSDASSPRRTELSRCLLERCPSLGAILLRNGALVRARASELALREFGLAVVEQPLDLLALLAQPSELFLQVDDVSGDGRETLLELAEPRWARRVPGGIPRAQDRGDLAANVHCIDIGRAGWRLKRRLAGTAETRRSVSALPESGRDRQRENPQVAEDGHALDVVALDGEALGEGELATPVDLHRPGHPGLHREAAQVLGFVVLDDLELLGPRADEAHVPDEHVPQLRKLVKAPAAQSSTHTSYAGIAVQLEHWLRETVEGDEVVQLLLRVGDHRAKLEHPERAAARAGAACANNTGPRLSSLMARPIRTHSGEVRRAPSR